MKYLKIAGAIVGGLIVLFLIVSVVLPKSFEMERSTTINAPAELVFDQVNDLRANETWSPWLAADPTMKITYAENTVGVGGSSSWTSASGEGSMTIAVSERPTRIENQLDFGPMGAPRGTWTFVEENGATTTTWAFAGENAGLMGGWFAMMMDGMVGASFEDGLARLKAHSENPETVAAWEALNAPPEPEPIEPPQPETAEADVQPDANP